MSIKGLKQVLGLSEVTFIAVGMTIGGGVFVFTGIVLKIVGPALPVSFALAVIPVFISMLPLAMLGSAIPVTGGNYKYPSRMISPGLSFVGVWVYILATIFGQIPLYSISCARYVRVIFPGIPETAIAIGLVVFFCLINVLGVKLAAQIQGVMVVILIMALVYFSINGLSPINPERFNDIFQKGSGNLLLGIALLSFTFLGANGIIELGEEIKNPGKVIPRALFIAFPVIIIIYLLVSIATVNAVPWQTLVDVKEPLISVGKSSMTSGGVIFFIVGGAVLALTTTLNALFIIGTKSLLVVIKDNILPARLGTINKRFGTAHILFALILLVSIIGIMTGFSLKIFASYAALGGIIIFIPVLIASMILPKRFPKEYNDSQFKLTGFWLYFCPVVGIIMGLFFSIVILSDMKSIVNIIFFLLFILSGIGYYQMRKYNLSKKGIDIVKQLKNEEWMK